MPKAANNSGNIRLRKDGRWEARYTAPDGSRRSLFGKTQADVRQKLTRVLSDIQEGTYNKPAQMTLNKWLDTWEAEYLSDVKPRTKTEYQGTVARYIRPALGRMKLTSISTSAIQSMYNNLIKRGRSAKTVKNVHGILHRALNDAVSVRLLRFNPSDAVKLPRVNKPELHPFDEEQITAFLDAIQGHPYEHLFYVTLFCGLRQGEALGLTWDAVDFKSGTLTINKQLQLARDGSKQTALTSPKNGKGRVIKPAASVMRTLRDEQQKQLEARFRAGSAWNNSLNLVFTNEIGGHLSASHVYAQFKKLAVSIGAPDARFHDLRHSYAVLAIKGGDDILTVQRNLGHHAASFTLDVYGYITDQMRADSADRMEAQITSLKRA